MAETGVRMVTSWSRILHNHEVRNGMGKGVRGCKVAGQRVFGDMGRHQKYGSKWTVNQQRQPTEVRILPAPLSPPHSSPAHSPALERTNLDSGHFPVADRVGGLCVE